MHQNNRKCEEITREEWMKDGCLAGVVYCTGEVHYIRDIKGWAYCLGICPDYKKKMREERKNEKT